MDLKIGTDMIGNLLKGKKNSAYSVERLERLEEQVARFERIFKGSRGYGFLDWDIKTSIASWHGGFWTYLGYDEGYISQFSKSEEFLRFIHEDDRDQFSERMIELVKYKPSDIIKVRGLKRNGESMWVELRLEAVRDESNWANYVSGVVLDITDLVETEQALKISEARHARIIDASNDGIWEYYSRGKKHYVKVNESGGLEWAEELGDFIFSARCWELLGYSQTDDFVRGGLTAWRSLMHEEDGKRFDQVLLDHITKSTPFDVEYRIRGRDSHWRWIRARGQMAYDEHGKATVFSGSNMDITQIKRAEEVVMKAKEEAEQASRAKSEFLSSMSHELRTPLNAILGFAQLLEFDHNLDKQQRDNVQEIKSAGKHLLELVNDVLDLAMIEAGRLKLALEYVLPSRIIKECAALLNSQFERRNLSLAINFNGLELQGIHVDAMRLKQVCLNLMTNAAKYNRSGGKVMISCSMSPNGRLRTTIGDTGVGISADMQTHLFQPFNRLGAESSGIEGSGVGLVITKQLVEQMGGEIGFFSEENVGSQFWVEFPLVQFEANEDQNRILVEAATVIAEEDIPELELGETKRVLYVEDNPSNQKLMVQVLAKFPKLDLTVVGLAVQGLYVARSQRPDLIILDVNLPGINGYEMVEILKQDSATAHIPVVALSANVLAHDIKKGLEVGFDEYLTKPLNLGQLISVFKNKLS